MAAEVEAERNALESRLAANQAEAVTLSRTQVTAIVSASKEAARDITLDEAATRQVINSQLRQAG